MRNLFNEQKQKFFSTLIVTLGALLGFEALSYIIGIYQLRGSLYVAFYVYAFHIFWLTFIFDLHLKKRGVVAFARLNHTGLKMFWEAFKARLAHLRHWPYLRHYQNYLVLPGLIYWSTVILMMLNPFQSALKGFLALSSTIALSVAYWYMKEHVSRKLEHRDHWIKVLSLVKLYTGFLVYSATIGVAIYYGFGIDFLLAAIFTMTFLLLYQALFQHRLLNFNIFLWILGIAAIQAVVALWVYENWNSEYFTAGLVMLAAYNTMWGILHHYLEQTLTRKVVFEYLLMAVFIVSFLCASHNFNQRII